MRGATESTEPLRASAARPGRVSVVGSFHEESGAVTVAALLEILERIGPEVIFLESPPEVFDEYLTGSLARLESRAVTRFREHHQVQLVPVDLPTPVAEFFRNDRELHERVERASPEYRRLVDWHRHYRIAYGFAYLNSPYCDEMFAKVDAEVRGTVDWLGDERLAAFYRASVTTHERREAGMMGNVTAYRSDTAFTRAALLVGAAHRRSIMSKSRAQSADDLLLIEWDFSEFM